MPVGRHLPELANLRDFGGAVVEAETLALGIGQLDRCLVAKALPPEFSGAGQDVGVVALPALLGAIPGA